jgi:hypothetical protein
MTVTINSAKSSTEFSKRSSRKDSTVGFGDKSPGSQGALCMKVKSDYVL